MEEINVNILEAAAERYGSSLFSGAYSNRIFEYSKSNSNSNRYEVETLNPKP